MNSNLHAIGQSQRVNNTTRKMLGARASQGYINELSITGLTSNPTIFEHAIGAGVPINVIAAGLARAVPGRGGGLPAPARHAGLALRNLP